MNIRISLLWRTVILLTVFVVVSQIVVYFWIQRSVNSHFKVMDAEILTHSAYNLRHTLDGHSLNDSKNGANPQSLTRHLHSGGLDYDIKVFKFDSNGNLLIDQTASAQQLSVSQLNIRELVKKHGNKQFELELNNRPYRSVLINNSVNSALNNTDNNLNNDTDAIYLLALPIDVHHLYLYQFKWQLKLILLAITLLLISIATLSVYWGFSPLTTFIQKMKSISFEQLGERITVSDMPSELRPLAESYNIMMSKMEDNFESLSRYSDNIAHELRTPIAILSTQTQVMLSQSRKVEEYIEQLHQQHDTLEQLSKLINNLLLLAKTQKGLTRSQYHRVNTDILLDKVMSYYEFIGEDRGIEIIKQNYVSDVLGNENLLLRLFANLIANATYYAADNSQIVISALPNTTKAGKLYTTIIIENSIDFDIDKVDADKLFDRFYRHQNNQESKMGTGLGLSIAKAIVIAHKGEISIDTCNKKVFQIKVSLLVAG